MNSIVLLRCTRKEKKKRRRNEFTIYDLKIVKENFVYRTSVALLLFKDTLFLPMSLRILINIIWEKNAGKIIIIIIIIIVNNVN